MNKTTYTVSSTWFPKMELDFKHERNDLISAIEIEKGKKKHKYTYIVNLFDLSSSLLFEINGKKRREYKGKVFSINEEKKTMEIDYERVCYLHDEHSLLKSDILTINNYLSYQ